MTVLQVAQRGLWVPLVVLFCMGSQDTPQMSFQVGQVYYGSLAVAHGSFPVRCVKRTEKSVWFEHVTMPEVYKGPKRAKIHKWSDATESAMAWRWYVSSDTDKRDPADVHDPYTR